MTHDVIERIAAVASIVVADIVIASITVVTMKIRAIKMDEMNFHRRVWINHLHFCPSISSRLGVEPESFF